MGSSLRCSLYIRPSPSIVSTLTLPTLPPPPLYPHVIYPKFPNTGRIDLSTTICYTYGHPRDRWWCHSSPYPTMTIVFFTCYGESSTSRINNLFLKSTTWCGLHRRPGAGRGIEPPPSGSSRGAFTTGTHAHPLVFRLFNACIWSSCSKIYPYNYVNFNDTIITLVT